MSKKALWFFSNRTRFLLVFLVLILLILSGVSPELLSLDNLLQITQFGAVLALLGIGQALIMAAGGDGIDMSIGSAMSLSGVLLGIAYKSGLPFGVDLLIAVISGLLFGMLNAVLIAIAGLPPMIATMGTSYIYSSVALYLTGGTPISGFPQSFGWLGQDMTFNIPNQVLFVVLPVATVILLAVYRTKFGRSLYLTGDNEIAAKFAALNVTRVRFIVYSLGGLLAGISAIIMSSWLMTARADVGDGYDFQSMAVATLGGISMSGGSGFLSGVLSAVLIITIISSGLQMANINSIWQLVILGFILIIAVSLNEFFLQKSQNLKAKEQ